VVDSEREGSCRCSGGLAFARFPPPGGAKSQATNRAQSRTDRRPTDTLQTRSRHGTFYDVPHRCRETCKG
jgi:hypothetical protein